MQENLPKPQGCLILDDKTFLCPTPNMLAQVSGGLKHTCTHARTTTRMHACTNRHSETRS